MHENKKCGIDLTMYLTVACKCKTLKDGTKTYNWYVSNPINNYGVNINIGDYVSFQKIQRRKGTLDCTYYVLRDNLAKAKTFSRCTKDVESF
jgi:hypothetical protein